MYVMPASAAAVARLSSVVVPDSTQIVVPFMSAIDVYPESARTIIPWP